jgi:hypothetical protein
MAGVKISDLSPLLTQPADAAVLPIVDGGITRKISSSLFRTAMFSTSGIQRLQIEANGNIGIGSTPSTVVKLDVQGGLFRAKEVLLENAAATPPFLGTTPSWYSPADATAALSTNAGERMRIDGSGNVGIGVTPVTRLHVQGSQAEIVRLQSPSNTGSAFIQFVQLNGTVKGGLGFGSAVTNQFFVGNEYNEPIVFYTNSTGRMWLTGTGNLGIGTFSPATKLDVSDGTVSIQFSPDAANSRGVIGTTTNHSLAFAPSATTRMTIEAANGTISSQPTYDNPGTGTTVVVTSAGLIRRSSSSIKYKKDIENLDASIIHNAVSNLRPVWYRSKDPVGDDKSTWSHIGLIAEEVHLVEPRLVKYKTVEASFGENGEPIHTQLENPVPEDVDYAKLSVILLAEVKAQKDKISSLESRITALEVV